MVSSTQARAFALQAGERRISIQTFAGCVALAGLANAVIAAFILCRLPESQAPTVRSLVIRAVIYVACAAAAGAVGARFYWNRSSIPFDVEPPLSFLLFAIANAAAWVWVPSIVLLSRQDSPAFAALSALGAALLAISLRRVIPSASGPPPSQGHPLEFESRELFATVVRTPKREAHGYVIALCLYLTGYLLFNDFYLNAGAPLALGTFLFAWKLTVERAQVPANASTRARAALRFAPITLTAVLVTLFVLLIGIGHRNRLEATRAALTQGNGQGGGSNHSRRPFAAMHSGISGYESIILWPVPGKKPIVVPVPADIAPFADRTAKPLVIRFNGPYWYFQPPGQRPGSSAHHAHGNPLTVNVEANNFVPLHMEAVQRLGSPVRLSRYREMQVEIENRDNLRGLIELGILLTDSSARGEPSLSLGRQPVPSSEPDRFSLKIAPVNEVLRFPIPSYSTMRRFDQITVLYFPGVEHWQLGAKIAVQQFEILSR